MRVSWNMTSAPASMVRFNGSAFSPTLLIAIPTKAANTIICSTLPSASEAKGLTGIMSSNTCAKPGILRSRTSVVVSCMVPPMSIIEPTAKPIREAIVPVSMNIPKVFKLRRFRLVCELSDVILTTMAQNTKGATNILMAPMNRSPNGFSTVALSPKITPTSAPKIKPAKTFCQNGMRLMV